MPQIKGDIETDFHFALMQLKNDLVKLNNHIDFDNQNHSPYNKCFSFLFFSYVEGISYQIRQHLINLDKINSITLDINEKNILTEITYTLKSNGIINDKSNYSSFIPMFCFTMKIFCKYYNKQKVSESYFSKVEYKIFKEAQAKRNLITHPKKGMDMQMLGSDAKKIDDAWEWYHSFMMEIFKNTIFQ